MKIRLLLLTMSAVCFLVGYSGEKLTGSVIGTEKSVDYDNGRVESTTVNTRENAFDGDMSTYFASYDRSYTWVGLDLGEKHVITRVGWSPRNDGYGPGRVKLAMFEGANSPDFMDAIPLYLNTAEGVIGEVHYADVDCSRGFRYVRYVGPNDARCNVAEVEFYGYKGDGDDTRLHQLTNIPTVIINTVDAVEPYDKENDIVSRIIIISENGANLLDASGESRLRGNASLQFPKKPYRIKFDKKQQVLDAPAKAKKWTLINNYGDKTLMRNIVAFEMSRRMGMEYTPYCQPVDVVLNGEYKGCYQLCDQVEADENRINIDEMSAEDVSGENLTGGYHIEIDGYAYTETSWFESAKKKIPVTIKSPDDDEIVDAQSTYIKTVFDEMESRVFSTNFSNATIGYRAYLDMPSFLRYFLIEELAGNPDEFWSVHMCKKRGDRKIYTAAVWDFDIAFDNDRRNPSLFEATDYHFLRVGGANGMWDFVNRIIREDPNTPAELLEIWSGARNSGKITAESLNEYIDAVAAEINASQQLNFMRWPILNTLVHENYQALGSFEAEVDWLKKYVSFRVPFLDKLIGYDAASIDNTTIRAGRVEVSNGVVDMSGFAPEATFCIYNMGGGCVDAGECNRGSRVLSTGFYLLKITDGKTTTTHKIRIN